MGQVGLEGARGLEGGATGATEGLCVGCGQGGHPQVSVLTCWACRVTPSRRAQPAAFGSAQDAGSWLTGHQWATQRWDCRPDGLAGMCGPLTTHPGGQTS